MTIITITGQTCSGKTTLEKELASRGVGKTISHTTRARRVGETDGVDYHFVSDAEYDRLSGAGKFIERVSFGSTRYAMSAESMQLALSKHRHVAVVAEPVGTEQILAWALQQGIARYALWLNVSPIIQAQRFMRRTMDEAIFGIGQAQAAGAVRLAEMLSTEQGWRERAKNGSVNGNLAYYDHMIFGDVIRPVADLAETVIRGANLVHK